MIEGLRHFLRRSARRPTRNQGKGDLLTRFIRWRQRRQSIDMLHCMPDYLLKDIGISRGEIETAVIGRYEALAISQNRRVAEDVPSVFERRRFPRSEYARRAGDRR